MIKIYSLREHGWFENPKVETFIWKQLKAAFSVDEIVLEDNFENGFPTDETEKIFLVAPGRVERSIDLVNFKHPQKATYILGNAFDNLVNFISENDHVVHITTPYNADMFGFNAISIALYHRIGNLG